jgi:hypothetical protein
LFIQSFTQYQNLNPEKKAGALMLKSPAIRYFANLAILKEYLSKIELFERIPNFLCFFDLKLKIQ